MIYIAHTDINNLNLFDYNIWPKWVNKNTYNLISLFENDSKSFYLNTISFFYKNNISCIYPIILFDNSLFDKYKSIHLDNEIINHIKNKKCRLGFFYTLEGEFGKEYHYEWITDLCKKYQFDKDDVFVVTSNLKTKNSNYFTIYNYNFFGNHINFPTGETYTNFLKKELKKHFLCFNGIPRLNRLMMFSELNTNKKLINTSILSLRNTDTDDKDYFYKTSNIPFYKNYDSTKNSYYDILDWNKNKIGGGAILIKEAHLNTFLNVVTETMYDENSIYFSEKTFKPIYMCQPFIIFGNPHSLKTLKNLGYKTFDKWWDESYDDEIDLEIRFKKIISVLEYIATFTFDDCYNILNDMKDVLIENHKNLLNKNGKKELYKFLNTDNIILSKKLF